MSRNVFERRIDVWKETELACAKFPNPLVCKHAYEDNVTVNILYPSTEIQVLNEDSIILGQVLKTKGYKPLVLIYADHRFAGGDVAHGSGAQEESLFRRTNLCSGLLQNKYYPIHPHEVVIIRDVIVFRDTEQNDYAFLAQPDPLSFIACPGIHNPKLTDNGLFTDDDEQLLKKKIRTIFQTAQRYGFDALVLGPLGCGAWRCPPHQVAKIFKEEILKINGAFKYRVFACLILLTF